MTSPVFFDDAAAFGRWLRRHARDEDELVVGFRKVGSGQPSMSWPESVDEALCVGWIDGVRRRIDEQAYQIRFTPRRVGSIWSSVNIAKVAALVEAGRMTPAGLEAFAKRTEKKSSVYSYEQAVAPALEAVELKAFQADRPGWRWFEAAPPGYRKQMVLWVCGAKQPATRARRLARLIEASAAERKLDR